MQFSSEDRFHLLAAKGWFELGNHIEANAELEQASPQARATYDVLDLRWHIYSKAKNWPACLDMAEALIKLAPNRHEGWINRAYTLHSLNRTQEAFDQLLPVGDRFPENWSIPYNLACYCAQLGRLEECKEWFKKAMAVDEHTVKTAAIDDPDLKPLWDSMSGTYWRRTDSTGSKEED